MLTHFPPRRFSCSLLSPADPLSPGPVVFKVDTLLLPLIPLGAQLHLPPLLLAAPPAALAHQTHHRLLLAPALLNRHVGQVGGAAPLVMVEEGDLQAVDPERPVERVGAGFKVGEEGDGALQRGELAPADGREARVVQGRGEGEVGQAGREGLRAEGADAAAEMALLAVGRDGVPGHEERRGAESRVLGAAGRDADGGVGTRGAVRGRAERAGRPRGRRRRGGGRRGRCARRGCGVCLGSFGGRFYDGVMIRRGSVYELIIGRSVFVVAVVILIPTVFEAFRVESPCALDLGQRQGGTVLELGGQDLEAVETVLDSGHDVVVFSQGLE